MNWRLNSSFIPFLLGSGLVVLYWDMMGIYHALAVGWEEVPEPFPVFGFGSAPLHWFWGQYVILLFLLAISYLSIKRKSWLIGALPCAIAFALFWFFPQPMWAAYIPMSALWLFDLIFLDEKVQYLIGTALGLCFWTLDYSYWGPELPFTLAELVAISLMIFWVFRKSHRAIATDLSLLAIGIMIWLSLNYRGGECTVSGQTEKIVFELGSLVLDKASAWYSMQATIFIMSLIALLFPRPFLREVLDDEDKDL